MRIFSLLLMATVVFFGGCSPQSPTLPSVATEESWLVRLVATDLVRLAALGEGKTLPAASSIEVGRLKEKSGTGRYRVSFPGEGGARRNVEIDVTTNALDPGIYEPLGKALGVAFSADKASSPQAVAALSAFTVKAFRDENERISKWLTDQPRNVAACEEAAFLLGAFALRENSGVFWNPLPACARAAAFLAYAKQLSGGASFGPEGRLANLLIGLILDAKAASQKDIEDLAKLTAERPDLAPWVDAARFRNTRDWRSDVNKDAPLVVKVEKFRALCDAATTGKAVQYLQTIDPPVLPDWSRIVLEVSWTVDDGHRFTEGLIAEELRELITALGRPAPEDEAGWRATIETLNLPATPVGIGNGPRLVVIDEAMWAQSAQRHLAHAIHETWRFLAVMLAVPKEAQTFWGQMEKSFGKLELFPAVNLLRCDGATGMKPFASRLEALLKDKPELVPDIVWARACEPSFASLFPSAPSLAGEWFSPPILPGTAYRFGARDQKLPNFRQPTPEQIEPIYRRASLQPSAAEAFLRTKAADHAVTEEEIRTVAGPLLDYCLPVIVDAARATPKTLPFHERMLENAARISADYAFKLAKFYLATKRPDQAAVAYQAYVDGATNRVAVANECEWLVNYYFDHGQKERALEIARMAAEVYSFQGLNTCARLQERMNDLAGAEENFRNIAERYDDSAPLYQFYSRHALQVVYAKKAKELVAPVFPEGIVPVGLADFTAPPTRGVVIREDNELLRKNGLRVNDVVVAFDGKRVDTLEQYLFLRSFSDDPRFRLVIFRDGKFQEVRASAPKRRFNAEMTTWSGEKN